MPMTGLRRLPKSCLIFLVGMAGACVKLKPVTRLACATMLLGADSRWHLL